MNHPVKNLIWIQSETTKINIFLMKHFLYYYISGGCHFQHVNTFSLKLLVSQILFTLILRIVQGILLPLNFGCIKFYYLPVSFMLVSSFWCCVHNGECMIKNNNCMLCAVIYYPFRLARFSVPQRLPTDKF